jgi:hypothetical protein
MSRPPITSEPLLTDTERRELDVDTPPARVRPIFKVLFGVFVLVNLAVWTYALWGPRHPSPGTMDSFAFGEAAEPLCARAVATIDALPPAHLTTDPAERADVIDEANVALEEQLESLEPLVALTPDGSEDRRRVTEWLGDWRTYLDDREVYPVELRADRDARFRETAKDDDQISQALTYFAQKNEMPSCAPPGDLA